MSHTIPVFDLRVLQGERRAETVAAIRRAAEEVGFFAVSHTGTNEPAVADAFDAAQRFFAQPRWDKESWRYRSTELNHGWVAPGQEALDPSKPADLKESFTMRNVAHTMTRAELWPDSPFRDAAYALYRESQALAQQLLMVLAEGRDCRRTGSSPLIPVRTRRCVCCTTPMRMRLWRKGSWALGNIPITAASPCCGRTRPEVWR